MEGRVLMHPMQRQHLLKVVAFIATFFAAIVWLLNGGRFP